MFDQLSEYHFNVDKSWLRSLNLLYIFVRRISKSIIIPTSEFGSDFCLILSEDCPKTFSNYDIRSFKLLKRCVCSAEVTVHFLNYLVLSCNYIKCCFVLFSVVKLTGIHHIHSFLPVGCCLKDKIFFFALYKQRLSDD
jgi:hypothetical protein